MSRMFIALAAAASVLTFAAGAQAHTQTQDRVADQRTVQARVDFNDASQTRAYYAKLQAAAHSVCASESGDPATQNADRACERDALSTAVRQIDAPQLSQLDERTNGRNDSSAPMLASAGR